MDEAERTLVLERWNATARDYPQRNIAELFEAEAQRRPKAVGEVFGAEQVSYAGLNRRANRLALPAQTGSKSGLRQWVSASSAC
jgi:non-ribosomal peptide synthetase component F